MVNHLCDGGGMGSIRKMGLADDGHDVIWGGIAGVLVVGMDPFIDGIDGGDGGVVALGGGQEKRMESRWRGH